MQGDVVLGHSGESLSQALSVIRPMEIDFLVRGQRPHGFCCRVKIFHRSSQIVFFPTTKHPKAARLAFDRAQVLKWALSNNCNSYLAVFFLHFWTILTVRRYARALKLWNEVPSNKFQTSLPQKLVTKDES